jgi:CoA-transferase family III
VAAPDAAGALRSVWQAAGAEPGALEAMRFVGPSEVLPARYPVTAAAAGAVAAGVLAGACLAADAAGAAETPPVEVDRTHASLACRSERYLEADGLPAVPDPRGGDLRCADGWIRIHTLYPHHRAAARRVLGGATGRGEVAAAVGGWQAEQLQEAVVAAGGAAARLQTTEGWAASAPGRAARAQPLVDVRRAGDGPAGEPGFRVLDLTRVIAGPTATKLLALHGAEVLRLEPPGFPEVPVLAVDTGFGKRSATLDLRAAGDRATFEGLVRDADVVVTGYRPGAMAALGYGEDDLAARRPGLVTASLSAWGTAGPWAARRGFDSLVQMASGIAGAAMEAGDADEPAPLPLQLLDHATAHLLATGVLTALRRRRREGGTWRVAVALARTAVWLQDLGRVDVLDVPEPDGATVDRYRAERPSAWGRLRHVRPAGTIGGRPLDWARAPEPAGSSPPRWW